MSAIIGIKFIAGRFHATPWDRQVNEGATEWPPSPWRILRALVSAYYRMPEAPDRSDLLPLFSRLSESLPKYILPPSTSAHTRHYMPVWKEGKATTAKIFDTFVALEKEAEVIVAWQAVELSAAERQLLENLCRHVSYLGRAESWVEMTLRETCSQEFNVVPIEKSGEENCQGERVKVLAPLTGEGLEGFRAALTALPPGKGKKKWRIPADVLEVLELDVGDLHAQGWSGIPGARWVPYLLCRGEALANKSLQSTEEFSTPMLRPYIAGERPNFARYILVSNVLPNLTEALWIGDRIRAALMCLSDGDSAFSGRDERGEWSKDDHQHAFYLPETNEYGKIIESVVVYARSGFSLEQAVPALQKLTVIKGSSANCKKPLQRQEKLQKLTEIKKISANDVQAVLVGLGKIDDYRADVGKGEVKGRSLVVGRGRIWQSLTPVVLPRHPKVYRTGAPKIDPETGWQIDGAEDQIRKLLRQQNFDEPLRVEVIEDGKEVGRYPWYAFRRDRLKGGGDKGSDRGWGFRLEFEKPQEGPIALGYGAHYGLGVFVPVG